MTKSSADQDEVIGRGFVLCLIIAGLSVFLYQSYLFLRHGELFLFSLIDAMEIINRYTYFAGEWVANPKDWTGLHLIMSWVPLAPVLWLSGFYLLADIDN